MKKGWSMQRPGFDVRHGRSDHGDQEDHITPSGPGGEEEEPAEDTRVKGASSRSQEEQRLRILESIRRRRRAQARNEEDTGEEETDPDVPFTHADVLGKRTLRPAPGPKPKRRAQACCLLTQAWHPREKKVTGQWDPRCFGRVQGSRQSA